VFFHSRYRCPPPFGALIVLLALLGACAAPVKPAPRSEGPSGPIDPTRVCRGPVPDGLGYAQAIKMAIERCWVPGPSVRPGMECEVMVTQSPDGTVTSVKLRRCRGDRAFLGSVESAVWKASPLPVPADPQAFSADILFRFHPALPDTAAP
jgi:colicin import membrane protein